MATQNLPIPTQESSAQLLNLATHILEEYQLEMADGAINKNYVTAFLKSKGEIKVDGGLDFAESILKSENTNFGWGDPYSTIAADYQDPSREFKYDPKVLKGVLVLNKLHIAMNGGRAAKKKLMTTIKMQGETTVANKLNAAMWASSPAATEPESLRSIISTTPTTGSIGGQSRAGNSWAQNKADSTSVTSLGSAAGFASLHKSRISLGGGAKTMPDFAVTTATNFGKIYGYLDTLRQLRASEQMTKLGFDNVYLGTALLGFDGDGGTDECPSNYLYWLNSKHLHLKVLSEGYFKYEPFSFKGNDLNATSVFYAFCNLTCNLPPALGVMTSITA